MTPHEPRPSVVLICHEEAELDVEGLASWLAHSMILAGLVVIRDQPRRILRAARREIRRSGWLRFADVIAFRLYARACLARADAAFAADALARLRAAYPSDLTGVPRVTVTDPNANETGEFLARLRPDLIIARCKFILKPAIFNRARVGTFVLHPGICPEYRNSHGCFWALVHRDLERVGMTLLRVDQGVDTGTIYLQASCDVDELRESHTVIQYRVVLENLDAIGGTLASLAAGRAVPPVPTAGRRSAVWGQPRLSDYLRWKWSARRSRHDSQHVVAVP